ncbi:MAG: AzlC family ABC transporter permease, partial [Oceanidesulfovibrio sp.]
MSRARTHFLLGLRAVSPILLGVAPFGVIAGISIIEAGRGPVDATLFSLLTFAGASQIASIELLKDGAPMLIAALTGLVINMRYLMYSASIAPHFADR